MTDHTELYLRPKFLEAAFTPNPAIESQPTTLRLRVVDVMTCAVFSGEVTSGEVTAG